ncbi:diphosphomevalonate decarboxylase-like [Oppia nitens]|uniref:diphosphomevalonate decarboxylase-like n=1 Tax=Oppia nitens TaxID=1686743 RepID=UPI0023DB9D30|nr:diphosphomevalonate decarboxylase-like [Oppia nitens]
MKSITVRAPVNIAVIKYWGKRDEDIIIPLNDSISGTLSIDDMCAKTSVATSAEFTEDQMWLNGQKVDIAANKRLVNCLNQIRKISTVDWIGQRLHICSVNNFPTAAGLASSAAGYACLMYALAKLYGIDSAERISTLARIGSGSACRSVYGGFVQWIAGHDNETSVARQIVDENYWPEMRVLVLVVRDTQKDTSSTSGMQLTVQTSRLMQQRLKEMPDKIQAMTRAIKDRDFHRFAEIAIRESNQMHATCEDTYPPLQYMNDTSRAIRRFCHKFNDYYGQNRLGYTYDAGPNACLYLLAPDVPNVIQLLRKWQPDLIVKGQPIDGQTSAAAAADHQLDDDLSRHFDKMPADIVNGSLRYVISTRIGSGPQVLTDDDQSLLDMSTGLPKQQNQ